MPFDFKKYDAKCAVMDPDALQREWEHYTRLISGAATSTAVSGLAIPFTLGMSTIGVGLAAPAIHNAKKKREIIERHLQRHGRTHHTRKRDVITAGAISGTVGVVTLGLAPVGADAITSAAAEHGFSYIAANELGVKAATHLAFDAAAVAMEETHMHSKKEQEAWKAYAKGVKEGKNPPFPNADLKTPMTTNYPTVPIPTPYQDTFAPSINIVPPSDQKNPAEFAAAAHYPPPPFPLRPQQTDLKVEHPLKHRHSFSNMPSEVHKPTNPSFQPYVESHYVVGTTTAINHPMPGGQSYYIQVSGQPQYVPERPLSAMAGGTLPPEVEKFSLNINDAAQYGTASPFQPAPRLGLAAAMKIQQDQAPMPTQRARAHSIASPPPPYSPPSPAMPPSSPYQHPITPATGYTSNQNYQPTWSAQYNPSDYAPSPSPSYAQPRPLQPDFYTSHAPAEVIHCPQPTSATSWFYNDQKTGCNYHHEVPPSPAVTPAAPTWSSSLHQAQDNRKSGYSFNSAQLKQMDSSYPNQTYPSEKTASVTTQEVPYFPPPPPTAY